MKRQGEMPIGSILSNVLDANPNLQDNYRKYRIKSLWKEISGEYVANSTDDISFSGRTMIVKVKSSIIRSEIMLIRHQLIYRINQMVGGNCVNELIVR